MDQNSSAKVFPITFQIVFRINCLVNPIISFTGSLTPPRYRSDIYESDSFECRCKKHLSGCQLSPDHLFRGSALHSIDSSVAYTAPIVTGRALLSSEYFFLYCQTAELDPLKLFISHIFISIFFFFHL